jgi:hypothetical protein
LVLSVQVAVLTQALKPPAVLQSVAMPPLLVQVGPDTVLVQVGEPWGTSAKVPFTRQNTSELGVQDAIGVNAPSSTPVLLHSTALASPLQLVPLSVVVQECALVKAALTRHWTFDVAVSQVARLAQPAGLKAIARHSVALPPLLVHVGPETVLVQVGA